MFNLSDRILILDGAFGTELQKLGVRSETGCNDFLAISNPEIVASISRSYLQSGADIITTNTFNSNAVSLKEYGLENRVREMNLAAVNVARQEAQKYGAYVAGSVGPTSKSLSISPDMENPAIRAIYFDELKEAYRQQISALIDGGVDLILIETAFDTLNAKAAIMALRHDLALRDFPLVISGTLTDGSGRTLSGQTIEAFYYSIEHAHPIAVGLNCSFGAEKMKPYIERLSRITKCGISAHPNAGLPDIDGKYSEPVSHMASIIESYMKDGLLNIVGGCCGTTPEYIAAIKEISRNYKPRQIKGTGNPDQSYGKQMVLTGLDVLEIDRNKNNFINVGERSNVAGSKKFADLVAAENFSDAVNIAIDQVEGGAQIVDVCMDAPMIDAKSAMKEYLLRLQSEPIVSVRPTMIDSSSFDVIEEGLKTQQGKSIVNSISLKEGEEKFIEHARLIRDYGAAMVVMLFDEKGQADTYERKIEVAERAYRILTENGVESENIVFDPNILSVATGIPSHDSYAIDFIRATKWIKENLPGVKVSGGVSNLSFSFRGNNEVRRAMHSVFLYHAMNAGMDMAILNPSMIQIYDEIPHELREKVENVILNTSSDATEKLIEFATSYKDIVSKDAPDSADVQQAETSQERLASAIVKGRNDNLEEDVLSEYNRLGSPLVVIDEILMPAMASVGRMFGEGKMFLPQVIKSARAMKTAVDILSPFIEASKASDKSSSRKSAKSSRKAVIATVRGDVHDIGKNIVALVLRCNGYEVIDLGVMVAPELIVETAKKENADCVLLSGLITPSLEQMAIVIRQFEDAGLDIPIEIGGATTSREHTALRLAPLYSGLVLHSSDASGCVKILSDALSQSDFAESYKEEQVRIAESYQVKQQPAVIPLEEARSRAKQSKQF